MLSLTIASNIVLAIILAIAGYTDYKKHKIYNYITVPAILAGPILNGFFAGAEGLKTSLMAMGIVGVVCLLIVFLHGFGYGDMKLLMGIAGIMGIWYTLALFFISSIITAVWGIIIIYKGKQHSVPLATCMLIGFICYTVLSLIFQY